MQHLVAIVLADSKPLTVKVLKGDNSCKSIGVYPGCLHDCVRSLQLRVVMVICIRALQSRYVSVEEKIGCGYKRGSRKEPFSL